MISQPLGLDVSLRSRLASASGNALALALIAVALYALAVALYGSNALRIASIAWLVLP